MWQSFLVIFREGLEAVLIVGIILAYLARIGQRKLFKYIWFGTLLATVISLQAGIFIFMMTGSFKGKANQIFEGVAIFAAVIALTYMIFWMRKQAQGIGKKLRSKVDLTLRSYSTIALVAVPFTAVLREGTETVLFMTAISITTTTTSSIIGGLLGLAGAIALGYLFYTRSRHLNLSLFFNITGILLILFAAGLLAYGIHEFHKAHLLPEGVAPLWNINSILDERSIGGSFLRALFGYNGDPSLVEVVFYLTYLLGVSVLYFRPSLKRRESLSAEV